jgi:uncharacterized protein (TIGR03435 family)
LRSILAALVAGALAQVPPPPSFEVASVKPNPAVDAAETVSFEPGGGIRMTGYRLINLILGAYGLRSVQMRDQIIGGPSWIYTDRFDIVAKAEGRLTFDPQGRQPAEALLMLKGLLEDRFKVRVHTEEKAMRAFALSVARRDGRLGPRLTESTMECPHYGAGESSPAPVETDRWCGFRHFLGRVDGRFVTMSEIASYFAATTALRRPVEDRTRLSGRYDFSVEYPEGTDVDAGSFFTAFREQLGLKFDNVRAQVPVLVIDHAEKPTPD